MLVMYVQIIIVQCACSDDREQSIICDRAREHGSSQT